MGFTERFRTVRDRLTRPLRVGWGIAAIETRVRDEATIAAAITSLHSPQFYNPTEARLMLLGAFSQSSADMTSPLMGVIFDRVFKDHDSRMTEIREQATEKLAARITDADRRRQVQTAAYKAALLEWEEQARKQQLPVDQATYLAEVNRILDEINNLRKRV